MLIKQPRSRCQRSETPVGAHLQIVVEQIQDLRATLRQSVSLRELDATSYLRGCMDLIIALAMVTYSVQLNSRPSVVFICCQYPYVPANSTLARSCQSVRAVPDLYLLKFGAQFLPYILMVRTNSHGKSPIQFLGVGAQQNAQGDPPP